MTRFRDSAGRNAGLGEPVGRQIDSPDRGILNDIPGDVRELEGEAEIGGAIEGGGVAHPHDVRHHQAHHSRHVVGVVERVLDCFVPSSLDIHAEPGEVLERVAVRDRVPARHLLESREGRMVGRLAGERRPGLLLEPGQPLGRVVAPLPGSETEMLTVDDVVAMPTPSVEHDRAFAHRPIEQAGRGREALRSDPDGLRGGRDRIRPPQDTSPASASMSPAVAFADPITPGTPAPGCVPAPTT